MANEVVLNGNVEGVLQGALYPPRDPDGRQWYTMNWCWAIPLAEHSDGIPDEETARIHFEGATFSDLVRDGTAGLKKLGFKGRAFMMSDCWRFDYAELTVGLDKFPNGTCDVAPDALELLEKMGPVGE